MNKSDDEGPIPPPPKLLRETTSSYDFNTVSPACSPSRQAGTDISPSLSPYAGWSPIALRYIASLSSPEINRILGRRAAKKRGYSPLPLSLTPGSADSSVVSRVASGDAQNHGSPGPKRTLSFPTGPAHPHPTNTTHCQACNRETKSLVVLYEQYEKGPRCYECTGITSSRIDWSKPRPIYAGQKRHRVRAASGKEEKAAPK